MELRSSHIQELDAIRVQCLSDLAEAKAALAREREQLERRYLPGHAPGDIKEENQELVRRIQELKRNLDTVMHEGAQTRKKLDQERGVADVLRRENESYKQALIELEGLLASQSDHLQSKPERSSSRGRAGEEKKKVGAKKPKRVKPVHYRDDDTLSLATSMVTEDQFSYSPPAIVRALV